ncbi:hypothetical protein NIIDMKKI_06720 [Mycobacterium kansasii]|uniref:Uncharacterized protein n=1 Tax=Mycobacterium kansasii TaxID=1768 RepID=A0A7G1I363_MYCKA|nr:hypothetical protein NIIDMKKI_06720 [Mycobacterium kansasii]
MGVLAETVGHYRGKLFDEADDRIPGRLRAGGEARDVEVVGRNGAQRRCDLGRDHVQVGLCRRELRLDLQEAGQQPSLAEDRSQLVGGMQAAEHCAVQRTQRR